MSNAKTLEDFQKENENLKAENKSLKAENESLKTENENLKAATKNSGDDGEKNHKVIISCTGLTGKKYLEGDEISEQTAKVEGIQNLIVKK